jgi:hypothetical protein
VEFTFRTVPPYTSSIRWNGHLEALTPIAHYLRRAITHHQLFLVSLEYIPALRARFFAGDYARASRKNGTATYTSTPWGRNDGYEIQAALRVQGDSDRAPHEGRGVRQGTLEGRLSISRVTKASLGGLRDEIANPRGQAREECGGAIARGCAWPW